MRAARLTNDMRDTFVRRVMDDVPQVDYEQQVRDAVNKAVMSALPKQVKTLYENAETSGYVNVEHVSCQDPYMSFSLPVRNQASLRAIVNDTVSPFQDGWRQQKKQRQDLTDKVRAVAYHCATVKALQDAFPEFAQYLPKDERDATRNIPMLANVVADFVKAGWPKGKAKKS